MFIKGVILMGMGMGIVFLFLIILILGMKVMSAVVLRFFPEKEEPVQSATAGSNAGAEIAIAIAAAKAYKQS